MPRIVGGPPGNLRDKGQEKWYEKYNVTCDRCAGRAIARWRRQNLCAHCLNPRYSREYLALQWMAAVAPRALAQFYQEASGL